MKRGERLFFCRGGKKMMVLEGSAALRKDKGIFWFWILEKRYFLGCARGLILKKRKHGKE